MPTDLDAISVKPGDRIRADDTMGLVTAVRGGRAGAATGAGLLGRRGPQGGFQVAPVTTGAGWVGTASGAISPRSGSTPGTGTVTVRRYSGTTLLDSFTVDVLNASSNTMTGGSGIESGQYCWVQPDGDWTWWVSPLACSEILGRRRCCCAGPTDACGCPIPTVGLKADVVTMWGSCSGLTVTYSGGTWLLGLGPTTANPTCAAFKITLSLFCSPTAKL